LVLAAFFWLALAATGGASRMDVFGQVGAKLWATALVIVIIFSGRTVNVVHDRFAVLVLAAMAVLLCVQLIPLPAWLWPRLPGRGIFTEIALMIGGTQPARPLSIVPDATLNALLALLVPAAALLSVACLSAAERVRLIGIVLISVVVSALIGLVQFAGISIDNPLVNETLGASSGVFANRNHQALFLAVGIVLAPCWALASSEASGQGRFRVHRAVPALGLVLWFILMIMATGSRAGLVIGAVAVLAALGIVLRDARRLAASLPRWIAPVMIAFALGCVGLVVWLSLSADRAVSLNRVASMDVEQDMRVRALPVVWSMIGEYFPVGTGAGAFDPIFRIHEPFSLLKPTYFNHAHNDYLEVILDTGLPGLLILLAALVWWGWKSIRVWGSDAGAAAKTGRLGSTVILLVLIASAVDYPARTPLIMALLVVAAAWLADGARGLDALRTSKQSV
jgi:O-antigen ligase